MHRCGVLVNPAGGKSGQAMRSAGSRRGNYLFRSAAVRCEGVAVVFRYSFFRFARGRPYAEMGCWSQVENSVHIVFRVFLEIL